MDYVLSGESLEKLLNMYYELCKIANPNDDQKDMKQDIKSVLFRKGYRFE